MTHKERILRAKLLVDKLGWDGAYRQLADEFTHCETKKERNENGAQLNALYEIANGVFSFFNRANDK